MFTGRVSTDGRGEGDGGSAIDGSIDDWQESHGGAGALFQPRASERKTASEEIAGANRGPTDAVENHPPALRQVLAQDGWWLRAERQGYADAEVGAAHGPSPDLASHSGP